MTSHLISKLDRVHVWSGMCKSVYFRREEQKPLEIWKWGYQYKIILTWLSNININFSNCLHLQWYVGWKSDHINQFKENSFLFITKFWTGTFNQKSSKSCPIFAFWYVLSLTTYMTTCTKYPIGCNALWVVNNISSSMIAWSISIPIYPIR